MEIHLSETPHPDDDGRKSKLKEKMKLLILRTCFNLFRLIGYRLNEGLEGIGFYDEQDLHLNRKHWFSMLK